MRRLAVALSLAALLSIGLPAPATAASVVQTWYAGNEPYGVTVDPRDGTVYVAVSDHNNWYGPEYMWAIDPAVPLPWDPAALPRFQLPRVQVMSVLDQDLDRLFVSTAGGLAIVDVPTHALIGMVALGGALGLALDPSSHRVYVTTVKGVALVDGATGTVLATRQATAAEDAWWMVAHDPLRHRVYVTNGNYGGSPSLLVLDDADLSIVANVPMPGLLRGALTVDPARGLVYVGVLAPVGNIYAIDETTLQVVNNVDVSGGIASPTSLTLVPETGTLYVSAIAQYSGDAMVVVDTSTFTVTQRVPLAFQPGQSALHPDGRLYVSAYDAHGLAAISLANSAPVIDSWTVTPTEAKTNDVLTTSVVAHDPDGDPITISYQWYVNTTNVAGQQQPIPGETSSTLDLSKPGNGDREDLICLAIAVSDGQLTTSNFNCWLFVQDSAPTAVVSLAPNAPTTNALVTAIATGTDADGDAISYAFTWKVNGVVRRVTSGSSGSDTFDLSLAGNGDRGDAVTVEVLASDDLLSGPRATASVTVADSAPTLTVSLNEATPSKRDVLVATAVAADADHDALTYTYVWRVNGRLKQTTTGTSATTSPFDLRAAQAEIGDHVTVDVTVSDGTAAAAASASATVTPAGR